MIAAKYNKMSYIKGHKKDFEQKVRIMTQSQTETFIKNTALSSTIKEISQHFLNFFY